MGRLPLHVVVCVCLMVGCAAAAARGGESRPAGAKATVAPVVVGLDGRGTADASFGPPICGVSPTIIDFGVVTVGDYEEEIIEIANLGGGCLSGTVSEACEDYSIMMGAGQYSLGEGEFTIVVVRFKPGGGGTTSCEIETGASCANVFCSGVGEGGGAVDWPGDPSIPGGFGLSQNAPNPFTTETTIRFDLPLDSRACLSIYSATGRLICMLRDGVLPAGQHAVTWKGVDSRGRRMPSGIYFCRLEAGGFSRTRKILLTE
jgi:hypothetical protein